jgi:hypothetical protein
VAVAMAARCATDRTTQCSWQQTWAMWLAMSLIDFHSVQLCAAGKPSYKLPGSICKYVYCVTTAHRQAVFTCPPVGHAFMHQCC